MEHEAPERFRWSGGRSDSPADKAGCELETALAGWYAGHELATPLHAIRGSAELMLDGSLGRLSGELLEAAALIAESARALERRLALLAAIERLGQRTPAAPAPVPLIELCPDLAERGGAPEASALMVEVCAAEIGETLRLVAGLGAGGHDSPGERADGTPPVLVAVEESRVTLALEGAGQTMAAGDGAIALELARRLAARSRGRLRCGDSLELLLTLPRAQTAPSAAENS